MFFATVAEGVDRCARTLRGESGGGAFLADLELGTESAPDFLTSIISSNNFFKNDRYNIGKSLFEKNVENTIKQIYEEADKHKCKLILPTDVVCSKKFDQIYEE